MVVAFIIPVGFPLASYYNLVLYKKDIICCYPTPFGVKCFKIILTFLFWYLTRSLQYVILPESR